MAISHGYLLFWSTRVYTMTDHLHPRCRVEKKNITNFPLASFHSYFYFWPQKLANRHCEPAGCPQLSFNRGRSEEYVLGGTDNVFLVIFIVVLIHSIRRAFKVLKRSPWRDIYSVSFAIIAYNYVLHIFFGFEPFMYTQHWIAPLTLIFIPSLITNKNWVFAMIGVLIILNSNFILSISELIGF